MPSLTAPDEGGAGRTSTAAAGWLLLTLAGWAGTLALTSAPPAVAYQHLVLQFGTPVRLAAALVIAGQCLALAALGRPHLRAMWQWVRRHLSMAQRILLGLALVIPSAVPSFHPLAWGMEALAASVLQVLSLCTFVAACRSWSMARADGPGRVADRILGEDAEGPRSPDRWVTVVATGASGVAAALAWWSYGAHPHVPDETVYLVQARYLAAGMWTMPLPPVPAGFNLDLMHYDEGRWFSPVPPGWPLVLAVGARLGIPWLVNPALGGLAVVLAYLVMGRLVRRREARLATLLLAGSPWFLFMSMNLMTHTLSLVAALAAAWGVSISRDRGTWWPALLAGLAVGVVSLVRPLEGLVCAVLLGLWSLGARHRRLRLAPSAALVVGTVAAGSLVLPYNALLTGSRRVFPIMSYVDKYHAAGSNDLGFGANRGLGWTGLDPFPGHGAVDVAVNTVLNAVLLNTELLGWPVGALPVVGLVLVLGWRGLRRQDWWQVAAIAMVTGAHAFYWFSGGPDFGPRYWYLVILPCCALVASSLRRLDERLTSGARADAQAGGLLLVGLALLVFVPWRAVGKYHEYRGMRPDVRTLAREHSFGRSLVLVRGSRHPDYASAAVYNPVDLQADTPVYAWDASPEVRSALLSAYPDRTVWILDGPTLSGGPFRIAAGPLTPAEALASPVPPHSGGDVVTDPVTPRPQLTR